MALGKTPAPDKTRNHWRRLSAEDFLLGCSWCLQGQAGHLLSLWPHGFELTPIHAQSLCLKRFFNDPTPFMQKPQPELICINRLAALIFRILTQLGHGPLLPIERNNT